MKRPLLCSLLLCTAPFALHANWPQFRGPGGLAQGSGTPPVEFTPDKHVLWKAALAPGHSSPCIWGGKIALTAQEGERLITLCLDRARGTLLWRVPAPEGPLEPVHRIGSAAAPTPCTDGERLFVYFGSYGLLAYDWDGREVWRRPMPPPVVEFGTGTSPIVADGVVYLVVDQDQGSHLLALDAKTGKEIWRTERTEFRRSFTTPFLWEHEGRKQLVVAGSLWVRAYDPKTGRQLWSARGLARVSNASPTAAGGLLLVSSWNVGGDEDDRVEMEAFDTFAPTRDTNKDGVLTLDEFPTGKVKDRFSQMDADKDGRVTREEYEFMRGMFAKAVNQLFAIKPGGSGDITESHVVWQVQKQLPYVSSPVACEGRVFTMKNGGLASAYRLESGHPLFQGERVNAPGDYYSSAVAVDGKIYIASQRGMVLVLNARSDSLEVLARNDLGDPVFASPAILDGVVYVRTQQHLFAFGKPASTPPAP